MILVSLDLNPLIAGAVRLLGSSTMIEKDPPRRIHPECPQAENLDRNSLEARTLRPRKDGALSENVPRLIYHRRVLFHLDRDHPSTNGESEPQGMTKAQVMQENQVAISLDLYSSATDASLPNTPSTTAPR